jgi:predicted RecA/RadA family phage recombinase
MSGYAKFERPQLIRAASGTAYWESAAFIQGVEDVVNGHATTTITRGMVVAMDTTAANISTSGAQSFIPHWDEVVYAAAGTGINFASVCKISVIPVAASTTCGLLGVALENIPPGATGKICTDGIVAAKVSGGTWTMGTHFFAIAATGTGLVGPSATPSNGKTLGVVLVAPGTASGTTGSAGYVLVRISPQ